MSERAPVGALLSEGEFEARIGDMRALAAALGRGKVTGKRKGRPPLPAGLCPACLVAPRAFVRQGDDWRCGSCGAPVTVRVARRRGGKAVRGPQAPSAATLR